MGSLEPEESVALNLVRAIKSAHPMMSKVFTRGCCFEMYKIIRTACPSAEPWYDGGHVFTKVGRYWFDVDGIHRRCPDRAIKLDEPRILKDAHRWPGRLRIEDIVTFKT